LQPQGFSFMKRFLLTITLLLFITVSHARIFKNIEFSGIYGQWGYNRDWYSKSTLHFTNGDKYDFTVHDAVAHDKPDFENFWKNPYDITIPQNSIRVGVYLNKKHTKAIEINFDHSKYVVDDQVAHITGKIEDGWEVNTDMKIEYPFLHVEHTNGANFLLLNYVSQHHLLKHKKKQLNAIWKLGGGIVIPRSDVTIMGRELDNKYHVAGYIGGAEAGFRFYPTRKFFLEFTGKAGYANYMNALTVDNGKLSHSFYFAELIGLVGYDINLPKKAKSITEPK
jgi:hypothetical protein